MRDMAELKFPCPVCGNEMKFNVPASDVRSVHITNADRIRRMTDEELTKHLCCPWKDCKNMNLECDKCLLDWLREEKSDGEG